MQTRHRIKEFREACGLSQERLGEETGMFQESVGRMERNPQNKVIENWIRVARALGTTVEGLYIVPPKEPEQSAQK